MTMTASKKGSTKTTFEQHLQRLEEIVDKLEQGEIGLEDSIRLYEEGLLLSRACMERLAQAELKVKKLTKDMNGELHLLSDNDNE
jgi:exodeoxyribonuclease VII small subunit